MNNDLNLLVSFKVLCKNNGEMVIEREIPEKEGVTLGQLNSYIALCYVDFMIDILENRNENSEISNVFECKDYIMNNLNRIIDKYVVPRFLDETNQGVMLNDREEI